AQVVLRRARVNDTEPRSQNSLFNKPVGDAETGAESPRIVFREAALARCFVLNGSRYSAGARVRYIRSQIRSAAVLFCEVGGVVVTQPDVQGQFARHFPTVLRVNP